jgi:hypothetical protein
VEGHSSSIEPEDQHQNALNKRTTPRGDAITGIGQGQTQLSPRSNPIQIQFGRRREDAERKSLPEKGGHYV